MADTVGGGHRHDESIDRRQLVDEAVQRHAIAFDLDLRARDIATGAFERRHHAIVKRLLVGIHRAMALVRLTYLLRRWAPRPVRFGDGASRDLVVREWSLGRHDELRSSYPILSLIAAFASA